MLPPEIIAESMARLGQSIRASMEESIFRAFALPTSMLRTREEEDMHIITGEGERLRLRSTGESTTDDDGWGHGIIVAKVESHNCQACGAYVFGESACRCCGHAAAFTQTFGAARVRDTEAPSDAVRAPELKDAPQPKRVYQCSKGHAWEGEDPRPRAAQPNIPASTGTMRLQSLVVYGNGTIELAEGKGDDARFGKARCLRCVLELCGTVQEVNT